MTRVIAAAVAVWIAGCDWSLQRMNDQPRCEPGDLTAYLPDGRCDQPPPVGTVAFGSTLAAAPPPAPSIETIRKGADGYARICATCHGTLGDARTPVARDMVLRPPPSLHTPLILSYTDARIFEVIGAGYGMMPAYSYQLSPQARWEIVHYVRVLQRSQAVALDKLDARWRAEAERWLK